MTNTEDLLVFPQKLLIFQAFLSKFMEFFFKSSYALIVPRQLVLVIDKITDLIAVNPRREQVDFLLSEITDQ